MATAWPQSCQDEFNWHQIRLIDDPSLGVGTDDDAVSVPLRLATGETPQDAGRSPVNGQAPQSPG